MYLTESEISKIICLEAPNALIDKSIATRQLKVIHRAFNHLCHPENKFIYIGDEVGLGKTYIAMGIASLLRKYGQQLFTSVLTKNYYQDVIIVPKKHLQGKWKKDYKSFIKSNYLQEDNWVKGIDKKAIATINEHEYLDLFEDTTASFHLFRMTSFSIARPTRKSLANWKKNLRKRLYNYINNKLSNHIKTEIQFVIPLFDRAVSIYDLEDSSEGNKDNYDKFKRLYAWLLNICLPQIECLIVDEAHNFKHGIEKKSVALRNKLAARYFGAVDIEKDADLLVDFPELRKHVGSRVEKLIFLSATPINNSLGEIPNQLECFLPIHELIKKNGIEKTLHERNDKFIRKNINSFMIRGLMELELGEKKISRNQYRHEHRNGNVLKADNSPLKLDNDLHGLIMGVVQYKVIKEIGTKNNKSFEIGMLASYESFNQSKVARKDEKEYEDRKDNKDGSLDKDVLKKLVSSYEKTFQNRLPHPKQDKLVDTLFEYTKRQEKALVFVRRIGSVTELEQRLLDKYEDYLKEKIEKIEKSHKNIPEGITNILKNLEQRHGEQEKRTIFKQLSEYLTAKGVHVNQSIKEFDAKDLVNYLRFIFNKNNAFEEIISKTIKRTNWTLGSNLKKITREATNDYLTDWKQHCQEIADAAKEDKTTAWNKRKQHENDENDKFFFNQYFVSTRGTMGSKYRLKTHRELWFELNYKVFNDTFKVFANNESIYNQLNGFVKNNEEKKRQRFNRLQSIYQKNLSVGKYSAFDKKKLSNFTFFKELEKNTFVTKVFTEYCYEEMKVWVERNKNKENFVDNLKDLAIIVKQMFNHGSGLLPAYLADCYPRNFDKKLHDFISESDLFGFVLEEIRQIINDYDTIINRNLADENTKKILEKLSPIVGTSGKQKIDRSRLATQFKMPTYPYILITTDIMKEGIDLHSYCQNIFHYGIAWNPTEMEQRTGRIDRIGSLSSRKIKLKQEVNLETETHVFYPYLADSLEVNQIKKVFDGMDNFIDTFYNDLSTEQVANKHASTNEIIYQIPQQKTGKLTSKFDYQNFSLGKTPHLNLATVNSLATTELQIAQKLQTIEIALNEYFTFYKETIIDLKLHQIIGSINLQSHYQRRGPFVIKVVTHPNDSSQLAIKLYSFIAKIDLIDLENEISAKVNGQGFQTDYYHEWLIGVKYFDWNIPIQVISQRLSDLVILVDKLEKEYLEEDAVVFV